jgi:biopolymer transport protein ExbD
MDVGGSGEGEPIVEINVTPMVDVLLCMLILFMVATPDPPNEKIPLALPKDTVVQQANDPKAALLVSIAADGSARLGKTPLSPSYAQMVEQFRTNEKAQSDSRIVIAPDEKVPYGTVIQIMAAANESGIGQVGIASDRL